MKGKERKAGSCSWQTVLLLLHQAAILLLARAVFRLKEAEKETKACMESELDESILEARKKMFTKTCREYLQGEKS